MLAFINRRAALLFAMVLGLGIGTALAFVGANNEPAKLALSATNFTVDPANTPGFPTIKGGDFSLVDHNGTPRTTKNPVNEHQLIFFGYANCKAICSQALHNLAETVDLLDGMGLPVTPVLVTVDPKRDTISALNKAVAEIHPKLIGLTGSAKQLNRAYKSFHIEKKFLFTHMDQGAIYSHTSFIFLLGPQWRIQNPVSSGYQSGSCCRNKRRVYQPIKNQLDSVQTDRVDNLPQNRHR